MVNWSREEFERFELKRHLRNGWGSGGDNPPSGGSAIVAAATPNLAMQSSKRGVAKAFQPSEKDIQAALVDALKSCGYIVMETGKQNVGRKCKCGAITYGATNDNGIPDLLVTSAYWGNCWTLMEIKKPRAPRKPEQIGLVKQGVSVFVESVEQGLANVFQFGRRQRDDSPIASKLWSVMQQLNGGNE